MNHLNPSSGMPSNGTDPQDEFAPELKSGCYQISNVEHDYLACPEHGNYKARLISGLSGQSYPETSFDVS